MSACTLCSVAESGYFVEFGSTNERKYIVDLLEASQEAKWADTREGRTWIEEQTINRYIDYWSAYLTPDNWTFQAASRNISGAFDEGKSFSWNEVVKRIPPYSIDSLLKAGSIRMMAQPIVDVSSGVAELVAYEMLARGYDENGQIIPPFELFAQAKEQGRMFSLDKECRISAVQTGAALPGHPFIFINFVPTSIYNPEHCLQTTMAATRKSGIEPNRIVFEVVETEAVRDVAHLKRIFDYYKNHGILCALDDVGAGFNNLQMMEDLEPNVFKLDRSISDGISKDKTKRFTAERLLATAISVGATALGEGIEHVDDALCLADIGYNWQQGYLYARPSFEPAVLKLTSLRMQRAA